MRARAFWVRKLSGLFGSLQFICDVDVGSLRTQHRLLASRDTGRTPTLVGKECASSLTSFVNCEGPRTSAQDAYSGRLYVEQV
ncbi:hypothetical protein ACSSS7_002123 [Eimeria intestinalis]